MAGLFLFAFLAGIATALSPCILPILPIVLSSSVSKSRSRPVALIIGLVVSFSIFTLTVSKLISLLGLSPSIIRIVAVVVIALLGLTMIFPRLAEPLEKLLQPIPGLAPKKETEGWIGGLISGASLGLVWTPCAGPILAAITALVATEKITLSVVLMVFMYSLGAALPLALVAYGGQTVLAKVPKLSKSTVGIRKAFGVLTIGTAVVIGLGLDASFAAQATSFLPESFTRKLSSLETSAPVQNALNQLDDSPHVESVSSESANLPDIGPAPEFEKIDAWLNASPLTMQSLRGKVVVIDFWTYSCINCLRTLPYVKSWYEKYKSQGLVVIGVHTPEFAFEKDQSNVAKALQQNGITYPVALDNSYGTWQAYKNHYWPAHYFVDAKGRIRHTHFGEGEYDESEKIIQQLLAEAGAAPGADVVGHETTPDPQVAELLRPISPETYVGLTRQERFASEQTPRLKSISRFTFPAEIPVDGFAASGEWKFEPEYAEASAGASLRFHFYAKDVYLVMTSSTSAPVSVNVRIGKNEASDSNTPETMLQVSDSKLYTLASFDSAKDGTVELQFPKAGVQLYAFTFG